MDLPLAFVLEQVRQWDLPVDSVSYTAIGAGSYNWIAGAAGRPCWFVKCDNVQSDSDFSRLSATFLTAAALREDGLEFVVAPVRDADGCPLRRIAPAWAMSVWPYIDGTTAGDGDWPRAEDRVAITSLLGRLHRASVPANAPRWAPTDDLMSGSTNGLVPGLGELWDSGPFAQSAQQSVVAAAPMIDRLAGHYVELVRRLATESSPWVLTHGEPHSANVIMTPSSEMLLIDWDSARVAPRERDLPQFVMPDDASRTAYAAAAGVGEVRGYVRELFAAEWDLIEIRWYSSRLRAAHADTADARRAHETLRRHVDVSTRWPALF